MNIKTNFSKFSLAIVISCSAFFVQMAAANVNIIYPIHGGSYPVGGGMPTGGAEYINLSFSVTCAGGSHSVKWGVNNTSLGGSSFYDQLILQQTFKLPAGSNVFWVDAGNCGADKIRLFVDH